MPLGRPVSRPGARRGTVPGRGAETAVVEAQLLLLLVRRLLLLLLLRRRRRRLLLPWSGTGAGPAATPSSCGSDLVPR